MTTNNPPPKDAFISEALSELEGIVANDPTVAPFREALRQYVQSTTYFTELPSQERPSPSTYSSLNLGSVFARLEMVQENGNGRDISPHQDYRPADRSIEDTVLVDQRQDWHDRMQWWRKASKITAGIGFAAGVVTLGLEYFLHGALTPTSTAVAASYSTVGGIAMITANRLEARLSQLEYDGLPSFMRAMTTGNRLKRWFVRNMVTGVSTLTAMVVLPTMAATHIYSEYLHHSAGSKETTIEQKVDEGKTYPPTDLSALSGEELQSVVDVQILRDLQKQAKPVTETKKLLPPYEDYVVERLATVNPEAIHDPVTFREMAIRGICAKTGFDNPDLITALYINLAPPRVYEPIAWRSVERYWEILERTYTRPSDLKPGNEMIPNEISGELQNNMDFAEYVVEKYIKPLQDNLAHTLKKYGKPNLLEAIARLVYTEKQIAAARKRVHPFAPSAEEKDRELYFTGILPRKGQQGDTLSTGPTPEFVRDVLVSYFALARYHQQAINQQEQRESRRDHSIHTPLKRPVIQVRPYLNDFLKKKGVPDPCPARYGPAHVTLQLNHPLNLVRPGGLVAVTYDISRQLGVTFEPHYSTQPLLEISDIGLWGTSVQSGDTIKIPPHTLPGTYPVRLEVGLSDNCAVELETTLTVTNKLIP